MAILTLIAAISLSLSAATQVPNPAPQEVRKLDYFLGDWTGSGAFIQESEQMKFTATAKAVKFLKDRFVRLDLTLNGTPMGDMEATAMMTYDDDLRSYRGFFFISHEAEPLLAYGNFEGTSLIFVGKPESGDQAVRMCFKMTNADDFSLVVEEEHEGEYVKFMSADFKKKK